MDQSIKLDHDNVPISHGNTTLDQTGRYDFESLFDFDEEKKKVI
jgi:hypothetical protein